MPGRLLGGTFEIYRDTRDGGFRWRLRTPSGRVLMTSVESYGTSAAAERGIELAVGVAGGATISDLSQD